MVLSSLGLVPIYRRVTYHAQSSLNECRLYEVIWILQGRPWRDCSIRGFRIVGIARQGNVVYIDLAFDNNLYIIFRRILLGSLYSVSL